MKKSFLIGLISYLIIVGVLWLEVFNVTGLFWWKSNLHTLLEKEPPATPELVLPPVQLVNTEEELKKTKEPKTVLKVKDPRLYTVNCECGTCQSVLGECQGGNICPVGRRQARELGIKL